MTFRVALKIGFQTCTVIIPETMPTDGFIQTIDSEGFPVSLTSSQSIQVANLAEYLIGLRTRYGGSDIANTLERLQSDLTEKLEAAERSQAWIEDQIASHPGTFELGDVLSDTAKDAALTAAGIAAGLGLTLALGIAAPIPTLATFFVSTVLSAAKASTVEYGTSREEIFVRLALSIQHELLAQNTDIEEYGLAQAVSLLDRFSQDLDTPIEFEDIIALDESLRNTIYTHKFTELTNARIKSLLDFEWLSDSMRDALQDLSGIHNFLDAGLNVFSGGKVLFPSVGEFALLSADLLLAMLTGSEIEDAYEEIAAMVDEFQLPGEDSGLVADFYGSAVSIANYWVSRNGVVFGDDQDNWIQGNGDKNAIYGNGGNDRLKGAWGGKNLLDGGDGDDRLEGGSGKDTLIGGAGRDTLIGGSGANIIDGGADGDTIISSSGADLIDGGTGRDSASIELDGASEVITGSIILGGRSRLSTGLTLLNVEDISIKVKGYITEPNPFSEVSELIIPNIFDVSVANLSRGDDYKINFNTSSSAWFSRLNIDLSYFFEAVKSTNNQMIVGNINIANHGNLGRLDTGFGDDILKDMSVDEFYGREGNDEFYGWVRVRYDGGSGDDLLRANLIRKVESNNDIFVWSGGAGEDVLSIDANFNAGAYGTFKFRPGEDAVQENGSVISSFEHLASFDGDFSYWSLDHVVTPGLIGSSRLAARGSLKLDLSAMDSTSLYADNQGSSIVRFFHEGDNAISLSSWRSVELILGDGGNAVDLKSLGASDSEAGSGNIVTSGAGDDSIFGGRSSDKIFGGAGFDTLVGGDGDDLLDGGTNPTTQGDILLGGLGNDTYLVDSALDLVDEGIVFGGWSAGVDEIISTADFFWDFYSAGDILRIAEGADDPGNDGTTGVGSVFSNTMIGNSGTNVLFGRGGADTYRAGDGIDFMSLSLLGLTKANAYAGVDGVNTVIVEQRSTGVNSYDIIFEFEAGKDKVNVADYAGVNGLSSGADVVARAIDDGIGNSYIALGDGLDYVYMVGLEKADLQAGDFIVA